MSDQRSHGRLGGRVQVGLLHAHAHRRAILIAGQHERTARRQQHEIAVRVVGLGSVAAKGRDRDVDQAGIQLGEVGVGEAAARHRAWILRLDQEVGVANQTAQRLLPFAAVEIDHDASLVAGKRPPVQRVLGIRLVPQEGPAPPSGGASRRLHLDYIRAQIRQDLSTQKRTLARQIEDAIGRKHRHVPSFRSRPSYQLWAGCAGSMGNTFFLLTYHE
jgi:hypothetical protein